MKERITDVDMIVNQSMPLNEFRDFLNELETQPTVDVGPFLPDDKRDFFVHNPDGSITRVAYNVGINGAYFRIPVQRRVKVPLQVADMIYGHETAIYEAEQRAKYQARLIEV